MMIKKSIQQINVLLAGALLNILIHNASSFTLTSDCDKDAASILLSNTLDVIASIDIILLTDSKYSKPVKISKKIAPGGMQTICVPSDVVFSNIIPCLRSQHSQYTDVYYTFNKQHDGNKPLAFIIVTDDLLYPTII